MPEEAEKEKKEKKPKKGPSKRPIIVILTIIIGLFLVAVTSIIVAKNVTEKVKTPEAPIKLEPIEEIEEDLHNFVVGDFMAKIINPDEPTYARIEKLTFMYDAKKYEFLIEELEKRKPQIIDIVNTILISSTPEIGTKEGKKAFKEEILKEVNTILRDGQIDEIFCEVILQ